MGAGGRKAIRAPASRHVPPSKRTGSPVQSALRHSTYSRTARSGFSRRIPDSWRKRGFPAPTAIPARPGAASARVAIAMAAAMGWRR